MSKIRAQRFFPVQYCNSTIFLAPVKPTVSRYRHLDPILIVILTGRYQADPPGGQGDWAVRAGPGDVVYWPAGEERIEQGVAGEQLKDLGVFFRWTAEPPKLPRMVHDHRGMIRSVGEALVAVKNSPLPQRTVIQNSYLTTIIAEYVRLSALLGEGLETKVARYIQEHMNTPISLDDLADYVGLERKHFGRKYKALTGRTPMDDVRRAKAEHAAGVLRSRVFSLKTAATLVGLDDPLMLSKWLHKYVGISVRDLRK